MGGLTWAGRLFSPAKIGKVRLKNRVVMLPMGTAYATACGEVTDKTINHYVERAKGGVGLITVGNISPLLAPNGLNQLTLGSDKFLMGHYELVEKVHMLGTKIIAQINHPGRQKYPEAAEVGEMRVAPSAIPATFLGTVYPKPREMTKDDIGNVIESYALAAKRACELGYDMVELHGAHGYLLNQFISPFMNKRKDEYGGSLENRMRFPLEVIKRVKQLVGPDYPIGFRISGVEFVPGGVTLDESPAIAKILEQTGISYLSVSSGTFESAHRFCDIMRYPEGWKEYIWEAIKKAVSLPVIGGGGLKHPEFCERLLVQGKVDFVGLARPLLADPEWVNKAAKGKAGEIRLCISCNECLNGSANRRRGGGARRCTVNVNLGRDKEFTEIKPADKAKYVVVVGGGPAGMAAAGVLAQRGHRVALLEKSNQLGGQLLLAGKPKNKKKILWLRDYLVHRMRKYGVETKLGVTVTGQLLDALGADTIVVATGARPFIPNIEGLGSKNVVNAWDLLKGDPDLRKRKVAVIGGGMVGTEIAEFLKESENDVSVIEEASTVFSSIEPYNRFGMMEFFRENKIEVLTARKATAVTEKGVRLWNVKEGQEEFVEAEWVVISTGAIAESTLADELEKGPAEFYTIGDCNKPRGIMEAVYEGSLLGRRI